MRVIRELNRGTLPFKSKGFIAVRMKFTGLILVILMPILCRGNSLTQIQQFPDGIKATLAEGTLAVYPLSRNAVRIKFYPEPEAEVPELVFSSRTQTPEFEIADSHSKIEIKGKNITVILDRETGSVSFADRSGNTFLSEVPGSRKLTPDSVMGEPCFLAEQSFESPNDEFLFGLGQFQDGHFNLRNITRQLKQVNSQIALPMIYSSRGYGLLWHQYGLTEFNPAGNRIALEKQDPSSADNSRTADVTTTSGTRRVSQNQSLYSGRFKVPADGEYSIFLDLGDMDNRQYVAIDGKPCIDFSNFWLPPTACALVKLEAGEHQVSVLCKSINTPSVAWKRTGNETTFRSPHAKLVDYVVFYGPSADSVIAAYRDLSGHVPMLPRWAYGFWQCRERYTSGTHLVETVREFRQRNLPMDVIVQDWQYWGSKGWGVPVFDETHYPDPAGFIGEIHRLNAHFNISIWSNPDRNSAIGKEFESKNLYIPGSKWLDYFNPQTRKSYWNILNENLFAYGVDSWWMDATEPENDALHGTRTFLGPGDFYRLAYPLFVSRSVYEGQRATTWDKRVCILTRSAFLGQQRYGTINWSGDIGGTWDSFKRQIVAGLNYSITGMPYWTTDIGGFFRPGKSQYTDEDFRELLTRWFQWGAFNPVFRIHGYQSETEPWEYGHTVEDNILKILDLRYRLLPYIYSEAWQITKNGSTLMRPLVMDFREDADAAGQPFEYLFGKSILVTPVTEPDASTWPVYLPKPNAWYDFWTGMQFEGGQTIDTRSAPDQIPLFVKAGSIIPMGPFIQYATERQDPVEIRIYPGADAVFVLYDDENDNYNYEKGLYSAIAFHWNDARKTLMISGREGAFPGMPAERRFNIVRVAKNRGAGTAVSETIDKKIVYKGKFVKIKL